MARSLHLARGLFDASLFVRFTMLECFLILLYLPCVAIRCVSGSRSGVCIVGILGLRHEIIEAPLIRIRFTWPFAPLR
jgi:hypothetical protein